MCRQTAQQILHSVHFSFLTHFLFFLTGTFVVVSVLIWNDHYRANIFWSSLFDSMIYRIRDYPLSHYRKENYLFILRLSNGTLNSRTHE